MTTKIRFLAEGYVTQTIEILNGETVQEVVEKLKSGEYMTTVTGDNSFIQRVDNNENIAEIVDQDMGTEYCDFEEDE